jgi:hypothetical protein
VFRPTDESNTRNDRQVGEMPLEAAKVVRHAEPNPTSVLLRLDHLDLG